MLLLPPILLVLGLLEFITLNQVITIEDFTYLAESQAVASVTAHASQVFSYISQARHTEMNLLELPRSVLQLDVPSPTDLVVYTAPIGAYVWVSSPLIQTYTYQTLAQLQSIRFRVGGALVRLSRARRIYRHNLYLSQSALVPLRGQNASFPIPPTCSINYSPFESSTNWSVAATPAATMVPLGPDMSSLSGLGWCGVGTESQPTISFSALATIESASLGPNMSSLSGLGWCGLGTKPEGIRSDVSTIPSLGRCGLGNESLDEPSPIELRLAAIRAFPICSLLSSDEEFCVNVRIMASSYLLALWVLNFAYVCVKLAAESLFGLCLFSSCLIQALIGRASSKLSSAIKTLIVRYSKTSIGKQHLRLGRAARQVVLELLCLYYFPFRSRTWLVLQSCNLQIEPLFVKMLRAFARLPIVERLVHRLVVYHGRYKSICQTLRPYYRATVWLIRAAWLISRILWGLTWILFTRALGSDYVSGITLDHKSTSGSTTPSITTPILAEETEDELVESTSDDFGRSFTSSENGEGMSRASSPDWQFTSSEENFGEDDRSSEDDTAEAGGSIVAQVPSTTLPTLAFTSGPFGSLQAGFILPLPDLDPETFASLNKGLDEPGHGWNTRRAQPGAGRQRRY